MRDGQALEAVGMLSCCITAGSSRHMPMQRASQLDAGTKCDKQHDPGAREPPISCRARRLDLGKRCMCSQTGPLHQDRAD